MLLKPATARQVSMKALKNVLLKTNQPKNVNKTVLQSATNLYFQNLARSVYMKPEQLANRPPVHYVYKTEPAGKQQNCSPAWTTR